MVVMHPFDLLTCDLFHTIALDVDTTMGHGLLRRPQHAPARRRQFLRRHADADAAASIMRPTTRAFVSHSHRDSRHALQQTRVSRVFQYSRRHGVIRSKSHTHPPRLLRALSETTDLAPSVSKCVELTLDKIPVSYRDERIGR